MKIPPFNFSDPIDIDCDWDIFYYRNILETSVFYQLQKEFNQIDWRQQEILDKEQQLVRGGSTESIWMELPQDHKLYDYFNQTKVVNFIEDIADVYLTNCTTHINFKYDSPLNSLQEKHRDKNLSVLTFQIFLQEQDYPDGGTVLHSKDRDFELPMLANSGGFFKNTQDSWHSVVQRGYHRKSLLVRYKKNNP